MDLGREQIKKIRKRRLASKVCMKQSKQAKEAKQLRRCSSTGVPLYLILI